jgi:hypothetical protein
MLTSDVIRHRHIICTNAKNCRVPPSLNPEKQGKRGRNPKTKARNLLERFIEHKEKIMRFLNDLRVPLQK